MSLMILRRLHLSLKLSVEIDAVFLLAACLRK